MCDQLSFDNNQTTAVADETPFGKVLALLDSRFLLQTEIRLKETKSKYSSIVVHSPQTDYRDATGKNLLFARLWLNTDVPYLSFNKRFSLCFYAVGITYEKAEKGFIRINLDALSESPEAKERFIKAFNKIFKKLFNFDEFGCCSRYVECSDEKRCIHPDLVYATACQYGKNLSAGRIFYGSNCNIN